MTLKQHINHLADLFLKFFCLGKIYPKVKFDPDEPIRKLMYEEIEGVKYIINDL